MILTATHPLLGDALATSGLRDAWNTRKQISRAVQPAGQVLLGSLAVPHAWGCMRLQQPACAQLLRQSP